MKLTMSLSDRARLPLFKRGSGFTMIEMITTMSIVAILLGIGVPSFRYITNADRASSEINGLLGDLQFARAQAIRSGQPVSVCSTTDQANCANSTTWSTGWLVFSNTGVPGIVGAGAILRVQKSLLPGGDTLQADNTIKIITFNRNGFAGSLPGPVTLTLHDSTSNPSYTRCLSLSIVGAMATQVSGVNTAENAACT